MNLNSKQMLTLSALSLAPMWAKAQANPDNRPNVVFIICDDLNDYSGAFGGHPNVHTPNIDRMAKKGVQFVNAQTNIPVSQPSRNSLFTGVYPHESKDFGWTKRTKQPTLKNNKTFMHLFKENGYQMYGTGKLLHTNEGEIWHKWGMKDAHNYGPFVVRDGKSAAHKDVPKPYQNIGPIDGSYGPLDSTQDWVYGWDMKPMRYNNDEDRDLMQDELHVKWAEKMLLEHENSKVDDPFFLGVGLMRPHTPLHAPQKYFDMYPLDEIELDKWLPKDEQDTYMDKVNFKDDKGHRYYRTLLESYNGDRELAIKSFLQAYLACVTFVDEQIGGVLKAVENSPYADNTIVVLTSDHGWQMGEKNFLFKNSPWEESTRIPMIWQVPNGPTGKQVEQPVALIDIYPTLIDMCDIKGQNTLNKKGAKTGGFSLKGLLYGDESEWEGPNGALTLVGNVGPESTIADQHISYRTKRWRYISYGDGSEELYDHENDPYEWHNLADERKYKKTLNKLKEEVSEIVNYNL